MKFSFYIARKYFFSKGNRNAINIISGISVLAFAFTVSATIIILSAFNGFSELIEMQISKLSPDLKIVAKEGKTFDAEPINLSDIKSISAISRTLEENVLLRSGDKQKIAVLKGVDTVYKHLTRADTLTFRGSFSIDGSGGILQSVLGYGVLTELNVSVEYPDPITVWVPNNKKINLNNPTGAFNDTVMLPVGVISVENEFDMNYVLTNLKAVQKLTDRSKSTVSALEIKVKKGENIEKTKQIIEEKLGADFFVRNKYEQNASIYRVMRSEKLVTVLILFSVILLASFSIIGAVSMLIIEKQSNIATLLSMGASFKSVQSIFLLSGMLIAGAGGLFGMFLGGGVSLLQELFGLIRFPNSGSFIVDAYPIDIQAGDFILVFFGLVFAGLITSAIPVLRMKKSLLHQNSTT